MFKKMIITTLLLGLFTGNLHAKESGNTTVPTVEYTKASKPKLSLKVKVIALLEKLKKTGFNYKAIGSMCRKLSNDDKKLLEDFIQDYIDSVKHEKIQPVVPSNTKTKNKPRGRG